MTSEDLSDWKRHPITQVVFSSIRARMDDMMTYLVENDGEDPLKVAKTRGAFLASRDFLNIEFSEISEETE